MEIWSTQYSVLTEVLAQTGISPMNWPPSASPTSGRPPLSGTKSPGGLFTTPSWQCRAPRRCASSSRRTGPLLITSRSTPACSSTPTSPPPSSAGSWTMWRARARAEAGELLFGTVDSLAGVEAHRRKGPYHRLHQRQPHDALRHPGAVLGPPYLRPPGHPHIHASSSSGLQRDLRLCRTPGCADPHRRHRRRPAGRSVRPGLLLSRRGQKHLRHRLFPC